MSDYLEIGDVAPSSLNHLIGQASVKAQVAVALEAAFADNRKFDSALLVGPPGTGKSALAAIIGQEMATDFHEVLGQSITSNADLNSLLLAAQPKSVVHVDESHELEKPLPDRSLFGFGPPQGFSSRRHVGARAAVHPHCRFHAAAFDHGRIPPVAAASGPHEAPASLRVLFGRGTDDHRLPSTKPGITLASGGRSLPTDRRQITKYSPD